MPLYPVERHLLVAELERVQFMGDEESEIVQFILRQFPERPSNPHALVVGVQRRDDHMVSRGGGMPRQHQQPQQHWSRGGGMPRQQQPQQQRSRGGGIHQHQRFCFCYTIFSDRSCPADHITPDWEPQNDPTVSQFHLQAYPTPTSNPTS